jgi:hypothetical protein
MRLLDKLSQASRNLRKLRLSLGPDSYFQYKRRRQQERAEADRVRRHASESAARERQEAENAAREREFGARYEREGRRDVGPEQAEEVEPDPPQ